MSDPLSDREAEEWGQILQNPAFNSGMFKLMTQAFQNVIALTDEQIETNSRTILADLRGQLRYERKLFGLATPKPQPSTEIPTEYVDSKEEAFEEHQRQNAPAV